MENVSSTAPPTTHADADAPQISIATHSQGGFWETAEWSLFSNSMEQFRSSSQSAIQDLSAQVTSLTMNANESNKTLHLAVDMMQGLLKNQVESTNKTLSSIGRLQVASIATLGRVEKKLEAALLGVRDTVSSLQIDVAELRNDVLDKTERIMTDLEDQRVSTHEVGLKLDTLPLGCSSPGK
jgi:phage-related protein